MTALAAYAFTDIGTEDACRACSLMLDAQALYANTPAKVSTSRRCAMGLATYSDGTGTKAYGPLTGGGGRFHLIADIAMNDRAGWCTRLGLSAGQAARRSDAALLLAGWERWGPDCLGVLNADFAMALWDADRAELTLARDFLGQRPLFYHQAKDRLAVASMPVGLLALPDVTRAPDARTLAHFVGLAPPSGPDWFFEGVKRVLPGTVLTLSHRGKTQETYWPGRREALSLAGQNDYVDAVREALDRSVAARTASDQRTGLFLSAGLDSGAVMASAARQMRSGARLHALTAAPPEDFCASDPPGRLINEAPLAGASAALYPNVDHTIVQSLGTDPTVLWDQAYELFQAPLPNSLHYIWGCGLYDKAQELGLTRVLTGQLGNYSFSYDGGAYLANLLASGSVGPLCRQIDARRAHGRRIIDVLRQTVQPLLPKTVLHAWHHLRKRPVSIQEVHFGRDPAAGLLDAALIGQRSRDSWSERVETLQTVDLGVYNKGILAGWGIDLRDPTSDRALIDLCLSIPDWVYHHGGHHRALARAVLNGRLPTRVIAEPGRGHQGADWRRTLQNGKQSLLREAARARHSLRAEALLDLDAIDAALLRLGAAAPRNTCEEVIFRNALPRALATAHFIRRTIGANF